MKKNYFFFFFGVFLHALHSTIVHATIIVNTEVIKITHVAPPIPGQTTNKKFKIAKIVKSVLAQVILHLLF